tara:strand:+ start:6502 stop:6612 length:111 start_codon:yes stop_codon:yes gene_type:complete
MKNRKIQHTVLSLYDFTGVAVTPWAEAVFLANGEYL